MDYFWSMCYGLQIISMLPLIQVYLPSCASLFIKDVSITNGEHYVIYSNFLGNTFWDMDLTPYATKFWYGFLRNDIFEIFPNPFFSLNSKNAMRLNLSQVMQLTF